jgi:hypothetical protein
MVGENDDARTWRDGAPSEQAEMASCHAKPDSLNDDICGFSLG